MMLTYRSIQRIGAGLFAIAALLTAGETGIEDLGANAECREQCNAIRDAAVAICDQGLSGCLADGSGDSRCYAVHTRCVTRAEDQRRQCKAQCRAMSASAASEDVAQTSAAVLVAVSSPLQGVPDCSTCDDQLEQEINACGLCTGDEPFLCDHRPCIERALRRFEKCRRSCVPPLF
jgi:hypothetical protein